MKTPRKAAHRSRLRPTPTATAHGPKPRSTPTVPPQVLNRAVQSGIHRGAFCSPQGALGRSKAGRSLRCSSHNGDRARWRTA
ncbi:hypothetical protein ABZ297_24525 [Nonomuraea sp. NPDC005983]|uniref:hypothetical protein n=1 Tax=Nonomuraea sp. NPDC005983 TaxID=3155595 RepID=UPI0033BF3A74